MHSLKPTKARAFIAYNYFVNNAPTDEFVRERLAREFAMEILKVAKFTRVDTPEGATVEAELYVLSEKQLQQALKKNFEAGYYLGYNEAELKFSIPNKESQ